MVLFQTLEINIFSFIKSELTRIQRSLSPDYPESFGSLSKDENDEQRETREAFLKITQHFLRAMKQEELADCLQCSKRIFSRFKGAF